MTDNDSAIEHSIRAYLEGHGGSVQDSGGRGLTDELAKEIGVDNPMLVSATLARMEGDGVVTREMRGLKTYRIALGAVGDPGEAPPALAAPPASTVPVAVNGTAAPVEPAHVASGEAMSLRDALSRRSAEPVEPVEPAGVAGSSAVAEPAGDPPAAVPSAGSPVKAMTLREALSNRAVSAESPPATPAPPSPPPPLGSPAATKTESLPVISPGSPAAQAPSAPATEPAGAAISLREALARSGDIVPRSQPAGSPSGNLASLRSAPAASAEPEAQTQADRTATKAGRLRRASHKSEKPNRVPIGARVRRLSVPVPEVKAPPSRTILTVVGAALAVLVLIAVISVVVVRPSHHLPALGTAESSQDACQVVTADQVTAAFGHNAGPPHLVLGTCVYDDGTHEFIVEIARQNAKSLFDAAHTSTAQNIPGIGDAAYYADGRLWVLKRTSLMQLILGPVPAASPAPALLTLAHSAVGRL